MGTARMRKARAEEIGMILSWAASEGWNPGHEDAAAFWASDHGGFFLTEIDGDPIAAISVVNHSDQFAFLGLYLCRPGFRGQGWGYQLWQHAIAHAGTRVIGLDGVPAQQANYRKSGFVPAGATWRYEGVIPAGDPALLRPVTGADTLRLTGVEGAANGYAKPGFMAAWTAATRTRQSFVLAKALECFATIRACGTGAKIGPLVATDLDQARALLQGLAAVFPASVHILDVPDDQPALAGLCQAWGMQARFNTARMYRGKPPVPGPGIRSAATLELG